LGGSPAAAVYALVACEVAVSTIMRPAQNSLLPLLSRTPEELTLSNLALSMIESGGVFLGPLVGAGLLQVTGVGPVFLAAAGAYLVSTLLLLPLRVPRLVPDGASQLSTLWGDMTAGLPAVRQPRRTPGRRLPSR